MDINIAEPSEKQKQFLRARKKYVGFGGARGGGKSWVIRAKGKLLALKYPGIKELIVRRTYQELLNNHINQMREELHGITTNQKRCSLFLMGAQSSLDIAPVMRI